MGVECWLLCVVRRMFGAQVCRVVRLLSGFGVVALLVVLIVPLFFTFLAMPGLCCFLRGTQATACNRATGYVHVTSAGVFTVS